MDTSVVPGSSGERNGPVRFVAIYVGWAWFFWGLVVLSGDSVWSSPNAALFYLGSLSPVLAGVALISREEGREGLGELWDRIVNVHRIDGRWYAVVVLLYPAITLVAAGIAVLVGATTSPLDPGAAVERLTHPSSLLVFVGFTLGAGVVEETGLTGYLVDRLLATGSALRAGVVSGVVWGGWHVPLFLMEGYFGASAYSPVVWRFFASFLFLQVLYTWIYDNTRRSVLAAILFHLMSNLTGELLAPAPAVRRYSFYLTALVTVLVVVRWTRGSSTRAGRATR